MKKTTNYQLTKLELSDSPVNIEDFNGNWDTIDAQLKGLSDDKFDKAGGTISGKTTVSTGGVDVTGDSTFNNNLSVGGVLSMVNPIRSTKAEFLQTTVPVVKGTAPASNLWSYWSIMDQNGFSNESNRLAHIDYSVASDKTSGLGFFVAKYEAGDSPVDLGMFIRWYQGVTPQIMLTHNPSDDSSDASVATTHFVNQKINANKTQLVRW